MSRFTGRQYAGAMRDLRETRRAEAQERDARSEHSKTGRRAAAFELDPSRYLMQEGWCVRRA